MRKAKGEASLEYGDTSRNCFYGALQSREIMPDYLHLSGKGYDIWGKAIKGDLEKLVK